MAKRNTPPYGQAQYSTHEIAQQKTDGRGTWRGGARARDLTKAEHVGPRAKGRPGTLGPGEGEERTGAEKHANGRV